MPYRENSLYVTLREAVDEIARVYYPTDHDEAADDFTQACKDGKLKTRFEADHQEVGGWEWRQGHQSVHSCNLVVRRADLLVIYPDLWKELPPNTANPAKGGYVYNNNTKRIEFRSPVDAESPATGAVDTGAAVEGPAKPFASTETGAGSDADEGTAEISRRAQRTEEKRQLYETWKQEAGTIKEEDMRAKPPRKRRKSELASAIAKRRGKKENPESILRRLNDLFRNWGDYPAE